MKTNFLEVGTMLQETAQTREEAIKRFRDSCNKCYRAGTCNERVCSIAKMHEARLLYFDAQLLAKNQPKHDHIVHVRQYNSSPEALTRKKIQSVLTRVYHEMPNHDKKVAIDDASVQVENEDYQNAIFILDRQGLKKLAQYVARLSGLAKEGDSNE